MGKHSERLFDRILSCEFTIVLSDWVIRELNIAVGADKFTILYLMLEAKRKIVRIKHTNEDVEEAKKKNTHYQDALHGMLAVRSGAIFLVTRNISDFIGADLGIKAKRPEEL